jgi:hypothetical protein
MDDLLTCDVSLKDHSRKKTTSVDCHLDYWSFAERCTLDTTREDLKKKSLKTHFLVEVIIL